MARTSDILKKLLIVLDGLENDMFEEGSNKMFYNGLEFTRGEWRNLKIGVEQVIKKYESNIAYSTKFINNHKEYNRIMRMIRYYTQKPVKKERDFVRLEKLQKKLEKQQEKIDEERKINTKLKLLKQQTEKEKKKYENRERSIEDEF